MIYLQLLNKVIYMLLELKHHLNYMYIIIQAELT